MSTTEGDSNLIDGKAMAAEIRGEIKEATEKLIEEKGVTPGLATVLVGERKDSEVYVRMKKKAAVEAGFNHFDVKLEDTVTQEELEAEVDKLNNDPQVHAILVQLPLPDHIDEEAVLEKISLNKDVDGFSPQNIGNLAMKGRTPVAVPCTPKGCIEMLKRKGVKISGARAVVLGRSNIVGIPAAMLLIQENATVTVCHSRTQNTKEIVQEADIVIAAVGIAQYVKKDWVKEGAVVIDVGINSVDDDTKKRGYRLVGDVDFEEVKEVAGLITPVPGGVGPMTIAMLMQNTYELACKYGGEEEKKE